MTWADLHPRVRAIAQEVLTDKQLTAWIMELNGNGINTIARTLDLARSTVRDRISSAHRTLRRHGVRQDPDGTYWVDGRALAELHDQVTKGDTNDDSRAA